MSSNANSDESSKSVSSALSAGHDVATFSTTDENPRNDSIRQVGEWSVVVAKSRVDSFSFDQLVEAVQSLRAQGQTKCIAIDLKATRFLSLQAIRFLVDVARELNEKNGRLALVAPAEKTKRHFMIYGSLEHIQVVRSIQDLAPASERAPDASA
jgi:anti-anti-sigma factor